MWGYIKKEVCFTFFSCAKKVRKDLFKIILRIMLYNLVMDKEEAKFLHQ